ncbi:hypothetical protein ACA910_016857 [Epithemia clementina (nom. ined.)]
MALMRKRTARFRWLSSNVIGLIGLASLLVVYIWFASEDASSISNDLLLLMEVTRTGKQNNHFHISSGMDKNIHNEKARESKSVDQTFRPQISERPIKEYARNVEQDLPLAVRKYCNLTGVDHWMVPENDWRRRTPAFLILGEKKSGTTGLFQTLNTHPHVATGVRKELIFFNPTRFKFWSKNKVNGRVDVAQAREALFSMFNRKLLQRNTSLITGEGTPEYLIYPDICDKAILCTIPWVKVIVIIREPIERLFSHYNFITDPTKHNQKLPPFDLVVQNDIRILQNSGVFPRNLSRIEEYMGTKAERDGYIRHQSLRIAGERQFIRSLYALQLEGWQRALRRFGKDPQKDMRVVISSQVMRNADVTNDLLEWLGLERIHHEPKRAMLTKYTSPPIRPEFNAYLKSIIAPYNRRLYKLLGDDFEGIFDTPPG